MNVALYCRSIKPGDLTTVQRVLDLLKSRKIGVLIYKPFLESIHQHLRDIDLKDVFSSSSEMSSEVDYMFSLGGDGTLLDTLTFVHNRSIPILGINLGRLGFLANIGKEDIEAAVDALESGAYVIDERSTIELQSNKPLFDDVNFALNDVTIHKKDTSAMIIIHTYINGELLNSYWADGLIVSTPTGSTAYSMSCGGPIIMPASENFVLTPIAPHNLNVRPIVVSDDSVISFEVEGRNEQFFCTLDSRTKPIDSSYQLAAKKSSATVSLVRLNDHHFLETLRGKLMWGADIRK